MVKLNVLSKQEKRQQYKQAEKERQNAEIEKKKLEQRRKVCDNPLSDA